jgi:hypothetical protein
MPDRARGYVRAYGTTFSRAHPRWFTAGGHGVVTTADDLSQWLIAQNNQGVSADGRRIATARTIRLTHTPPKVPGDTDYAMGWTRYRHDDGTEEIEHTGLISGDDAAQISMGLVELARGKSPEVAEPFSMTADWVLAALTLLAAGLGIRGVLRAGRWARHTARRPWWRTALRLLPPALPVLFPTQLASLLGLLMNRSGTLAQTTYAWPALVVCTAAGGLASTSVVTARAVALFRHRRRDRNGAGGDERVEPLRTITRFSPRPRTPSPR